MTTIVYSAGKMAADSKCTSGGAFITKMKKIHRLANGALLGTAGEADFRDVVLLLGKVKSHRTLPARAGLAALKIDFSGILVFPKGQIFYVSMGKDGDSDTAWYGQIIECQERFAAVGSGEQFALGALAAGRSAAQAVAIACRYDSFSAAPIHTVALKP